VLLVAEARLHVDEGLGGDEARPGVHGPHRVDRRDGGAHELALQVSAAPVGARVEAARLAPGPGPEGHLVHGAVDRRALRLVAHHPRGGGGEAGEAVEEGGGPDVEVVRVAVVAQVPDRPRAGGLRGAQHGQEARPVVAPRGGLDEVPAQAVPHRPDPVPAQQGVVLGDEPVMARGGQEVEAAAVGPPVARAFEPAEEEAPERRGVVV
jgi:hypothetical protein